MDLRLIETFLEAARRGSFSAAAKALAVTPAAVSQNVKSLEEQLQARLFRRTTRSVTLTSEGKRYFERCEPAMVALRGAADALADERDEMRGWIRISSTTSFGRTEVTPLLGEFLSRYPDVQIDLRLSDQFSDLVAEGFDFAIRGGILPVNDYISRLLLPVTPIVVASPFYAAVHELPKRIEQVHQHACIGMRSNPSQTVFAWEFKQGKVLLKVDIKPQYVVNDPEGLARAALSGIGVAQVGSNIALPLIRSGALVAALEDYQIQSRGLYVVYPTRRYLPKRVSSLITLFVDHFATRDDLVTGEGSSDEKIRRRKN